MSAVGNQTAAAPSTTSGPIFPNYGSTLANGINSFSLQVHMVILSLDHAALGLAIWIIAPLFMIGALLYFGRIARRAGRDAMEGAIVLAILVYAVFPALIAWNP